MGLDVGLGCIGEGDRLRSLGLGRGFADTLVGNRIDALEELLAATPGLLARFRQGDGVKRPQP